MHFMYSLGSPLDLAKAWKRSRHHKASSADSLLGIYTQKLRGNLAGSIWYQISARSNREADIISFLKIPPWLTCSPRGRTQVTVFERCTVTFLSRFLSS